MERDSRRFRRIPKRQQKPRVCRASLDMELGGLEPPTSWVRCTRSAVGFGTRSSRLAGVPRGRLRRVGPSIAADNWRWPRSQALLPHECLNWSGSSGVDHDRVFAQSVWAQERNLVMRTRVHLAVVTRDMLRSRFSRPANATSSSSQPRGSRWDPLVIPRILPESRRQGDRGSARLTRASSELSRPVVDTARSVGPRDGAS
jgi:hypothetical protein